MALTHSETIGFFYAFLSVLFFGSFGVPIKTPAVVKAQVDPVVFQCYKTTACFCTSWLALFFVDFKFTWWGVVGAAIWVVNGTVAIIAVQKAGLSVAQALWSGLSIFVGFVWGAYVFAEPIKDVTFSVVALFLMACGMAGAAYAVTMKSGESKVPDEEKASQESLLDPDGDEVKYRTKEKQTIFGLSCATYVGFANGSFMTPLKYANKEVKGLEYLISFGIGSAIATLVLYWGYYFFRTSAGRAMPGWHFNVAAKPALLTGLLWSAGNVTSILAIQHLGIAVGWPVVQCQLIVSTLWGIFYYKEVTGGLPVCIFVLSALVVLSGVVLLGMYGL